MPRTPRDPIGMRNISTTYQEAYQTLDGNAQVRRIGDQLWEILPRGRAAVYAKSKDEALTRGFELAASISKQVSRRKGKRR